ncbi:MAG: DMT family transporter [Pseudomonadota bacterium]
MSHHKSLTLSVSILLLLGFIWGSGYVIARYVEQHGMPVLDYTFWQTLGPGVLSVLYLLFRGATWSALKKYWQYFLVTAVLGIVIPNTNMYAMANRMPSNILAIVINISPLIIYPLALLFHLEKFWWVRFFSVLLGLFGIMLVVLPHSNFLTSHFTSWILLALITPFSFALCAIYITRFRPPDVDSVMLSAGMLLFATVILLPFVLSYQPQKLWIPINFVGSLVLLRIILAAIGYILLFTLLKLAGPVYYSLVDGVVILTGIFWGWVVFGEKLNGWLISAIVLIIFAILIMSWSSYKQKAIE